MAEIKLTNGFTFNTENGNTDDYELFEDMVEAEERPVLVPSILRRFLGEEDYKRFKECNRAEDGKVHMTTMQASLRELFQAIGEAQKK